MAVMLLITVLLVWIAVVPASLVLLRLRRCQMPADTGIATRAAPPCRAEGRRRPCLRAARHSRPAASDGTPH